MEKPKHKVDQKVGKVFLIFAGICIVALPLIVFSAFSSEPQEMEMGTTVAESQDMNFDDNGKAIFVNYDQISEDYLEGTSTGRTLSEYYSRRQYPGSPPFIPHKVEEPDLAPVECLTCHARGGWTDELKKNTPITPHPEQVACRQCHITVTEAEPFVETDWMSVAPPRLGRASLPGAPPPVPHDIQMRGNCISCHVGPGTVTAIRVEHPSRGNCRQCHVPETDAPLFERKPKS
jgi:cytochrome c-type protein NapB